MENYLRVSMIQPTLDSELAWHPLSPSFPCMNKYESERTWDEISTALKTILMLQEEEKPHIILIPEFGISREHIPDLKSFSNNIGAIIISGLDYTVSNHHVRNEGLISIPHNWPFGTGRSFAHSFYFGKRHAAAAEAKLIKDAKDDKGNPYDFESTHQVYILSSEKFGNIGLAICADFYDIERYRLYQGRIQHLFLIAYNKDIESFRHLAESSARLIFCNVVICNTGFYGGSMAFSPRKLSYERVIYSHHGANLCTVQTVSLPVESLFLAQQDKSKDTEYKSKPPGYNYISLYPTKKK